MLFGSSAQFPCYAGKFTGKSSPVALAQRMNLPFYWPGEDRTNDSIIMSLAVHGVTGEPCSAVLELDFPDSREICRDFPVSPPGAVTENYPAFCAERSAEDWRAPVEGIGRRPDQQWPDDFCRGRPAMRRGSSRKCVVHDCAALARHASGCRSWSTSTISRQTCLSVS